MFRILPWFVAMSERAFCGLMGVAVADACAELMKSIHLGCNDLFAQAQYFVLNTVV